MNKIYLHKGQYRWFLVSAKESINICSRRWGKSYLSGLAIQRNVLEMPKSTGVFVASSFRQAHSRTLPAALMVLDQLGWKRDIHYVIGHKPPKNLGFDTPYFLPNDLHDVVWFANGTVMIIVSQEVSMSANSMTINWLIGDEAKGLSYKKLNDELFPAMGGNSFHFNSVEKFPHLWGKDFFTDMPVTKDGLWLIKQYEKYQDEEFYSLILRLVLRRDKLLQSSTTYAIQEVARLNRQIAVLRNRCLYYQERNIFDNIEVVGADYIKRMERDLTAAVFRTEILTKRLTETEGKFYQCFDPEKHTYVANNNDKLNDYRHQQYDCLLDADLDLLKPIAIAFDYNAQITWLIAGQVQGSILKTLKSFFTKYNRRLREVIQDFCNYYQHHICKVIYAYCDSTAKSVNYIESNHDAICVMIEEFRKYGWTVVVKYMGNPMNHKKKHLIINDAFNGEGKLFPMFNKDNNVDLLQAIPLAAAKIGKNGFQKDKSEEKKLESAESMPYELRTDGTDAWDNLFLGCLLLPYDDGGFIWSPPPTQ